MLPDGRRQAVKRVKAFSFTNVCTELGLSPDHIRKRLRDSDTQASEGGRPEMIRRAAIRRLKVKGEARRSRRSSKEERGIRLWIQSVTSPTATIREFPIFRKRTLYSRGGGALFYRGF